MPGLSIEFSNIILLLQSMHMPTVMLLRSVALTNMHAGKCTLATSDVVYAVVPDAHCHAPQVCGFEEHARRQMHTRNFRRRLWSFIFSLDSEGR